MATFKYSVNKFKRGAKGWLTDEDAPALTSLENLAKQLDAGPLQASMVSAFGVAYRALLARKPEEASEEVDPLDDIIPNTDA